jgi:hypothetical protein
MNLKQMLNIPLQRAVIYFFILIIIFVLLLTLIF